MRIFIFTALGLGLLLFVAYDVYATILHASARFGPIGETLNRSVWRLTRLIARRFPRSRRHKILNAIGPLLLPLLLVILVFLVMTGFSLIYYPRMPAQFNVQNQTESSNWIESFYFSGITLTTLGYGDIAPRTTTVRMLTLIESASGIALISLAITYLIAVYNALERKRSVAISLYHQAEEGADVAGFIAHYFVDGRFIGLEDVLRSATRDIQSLLESHIEHPVIHYFHPVEVYKGMPRMLFLLLETSSVIRSCLDQEAYASTRQHPEVRTLEASARHVLVALVVSLDLQHRKSTGTETSFEEARRWKGRFKATMKKLEDSGIKTRRDANAALEEYRTQREDWESTLYRFAKHLGYDWDEVTGDRDLRYAADEEMEKPEELNH